MGRPVLKKEEGMYFGKPAADLSFISSGCELLDCVLGGGYPLGRIVNIVGDKSTGKTLLAIEACANFASGYPKGDIKYAEAESAFDTGYAGALGMPTKRVRIKRDMDTVEELFEDLTTFVTDRKEPGLYIVDSLDALSDKAEMGRKITEGTYGAGKARQMSQLFRRSVRKVEESQTCVVIISQTRDAIGVMFGEKHTRTGGRALDFYASQVLWLAQVGTLKQVVNKVQRPIGVRIRAKCKKNKVGLPLRDCEFVIRFGYGVDDIAAHLDWLATIGKLDLVDLDQNRLALFMKRLEQMSPEEVQVWRTKLAALVRTEWYKIERGFLPARKKYN